MKNLLICLRPCAGIYLTLVTCLASGTAFGVTITNFGYRSMWCENNARMTTTNNLALAPRPLIAIVVQFDEVGVLNHDVHYYSNFVFCADAMTPKQSLAGYFSAVSNGRFTWKPGAVIGPLHLNADSRWNSIRTLLGITNNQDNGSVDAYWSSNVVSRAMLANPGAFEACDKDGNGWDTKDEVQVLIFSNEDGTIDGEHYHAVGSRPCNDVPASGTCSVGWAGSVAELVDWTDFGTACHEVSHCLGTEDIYPPGGRNTGVSVMGGTGGSNDMQTCYLDPWHRMPAGWCEPRIYDMNFSSNAWIAAAQIAASNTPVILWDSRSYSYNAFWMLEFRNPNLGGYDHDAGWRGFPNTNGLALWYVKQKDNHNLDLYTTPDSYTFRLDLNCGPDWYLGNGALWGSDAVTRNLSPIFGYENAVGIAIHIDQFISTAAGLHVEWGPYEVWVDFAYKGTYEEGTQHYPMKTLTNGVATVLPGGTVIIEAGHSPETLRITKKVRLQSFGGAATIGR